MKFESWERIEKIYHAALEHPPEKREAFLDEACSGDEELRREVASLLAYDDSSENFIEVPALEIAAKALADRLPNQTGSDLQAENSRAETITSHSLTTDSLHPGQVISYFRILRKLGQGGMGEVYEAEDTRLERRVAIKVLPIGSNTDAQSRQRFLREARAVSALNHPNIVTIHSIEEADGIDFIVMEYVEGETLKTRIERGTVEFQQVIDLGIQIADAAAAAHEAGIIHRDLKPANILVTAEGKVKVLDFGLAKRFQSTTVEKSEPEGSMSELTTAGMILGTVSYMSPEQTRGEQLDGRTDIFSLGSLLYEAATGKRPFNGLSSLSIMHEIATVDPPRPSAIKTGLPREFDLVIERSLAKEKEKRYGTARELAEALKRLRITTEERGKESRKAISRSTITATVALLVIAAAGLWSYRRYEDLKLTRGSIAKTELAPMKITRLTNIGKIGLTSISPDGKYVAYTSEDEEVESLWIQQVGTTGNLQLVEPSRSSFTGVTFSPDSSYIFFTRYSENGGGVFQISILGGIPKKIIERVSGAISFSPDGKQFAFIRYGTDRNESNLMIANADGSGEYQLTSRKSPEFFYPYPNGVAWCPDGKVIACRGGGWDEGGFYRNVVAVDVKNGTQRPITSKRWKWINGISWLADSSGLLIVASDHPEGNDVQQIWQISYLTDDVKRITNDLSNYSGMSLTADSSTMVTVQKTIFSSIWIAPGEDLAQAKKITSGSHYGSLEVGWTPDNRIVFGMKSSGSADYTLWLMNEDGSNEKQLTIDSGDMPAVSPNGRYIVFTSQRESLSLNLWRIEIDGSNPKQLTNGGVDVGPSFSSDGKWVIYSRKDSPLTASVWRVPIDGGKAQQLTQNYAWGASVSPDGKYFACEYRDSSDKLAVIPIEGGQPVKTFNRPNNNTGDLIVSWMPDGRALAYPEGFNGKVWKVPLNGDAAKVLADFSPDRVKNLSWSFDGKQCAIVRISVINDVVLLSNLK